MVRRKVHYALVRKSIGSNGKRIAVLLVQRPDDAAQMPGMWELPMLTEPGASEPVLRLRHSITNTNFYVEVFAMEEGHLDGARPGDKMDRQVWAFDSKLGEIPLTGLARKILMRLDVLAKPRQVRRGKALPNREGDYL